MKQFTIKQYTAWRIDFDSPLIRDEFIDSCTDAFSIFTEYLVYTVFGIEVRVDAMLTEAHKRVEQAIEKAGA